MTAKAATQRRWTDTTLSPVRPGILQRKCACGNHTDGGECAACRNRRMTLQRRSISNEETSGVPPIVHEVLKSPGQPLDTQTREFMEPRFGHDFSHVRLHTNAKATESTQAVDALAYTVGRNIAFGAGEYAPGSIGGRKLLAHELTHTIQQSQTPNDLPRGMETVLAPRDRFEAEADDVADHIVDRGDVGALSVSPVGLQRQRATPATPSAPSLPVRERRQNVGRGGGRFDAQLDRSACLLAATMRVAFNYVNTPATWPSRDVQMAWQNDFVETVTGRWSGRYDLASTRAPCPGETCERLGVLLQIVPVTSGQHFTVTAGYTTSFAGSYVSGRTATLDYLDVRERNDVSQVPAEHEFGHMLGLPHVKCPRNDRVCYGVTDAEQANIMGLGSSVSKRDYQVFSEVAELFSACGWTPVEKRTNWMGILLGGGIGAAIGGALGAILGPIGALVGGLVGAAVGALVGAAS